VFFPSDWFKCPHRNGSSCTWNSVDNERPNDSLTLNRFINYSVMLTNESVPVVRCSIDPTSLGLYISEELACCLCHISSEISELLI
jgi:hypothetical protein